MSEGRFASLTAGLLVRKGDARPSAIVVPWTSPVSRGPERIQLSPVQDWTPAAPSPVRKEAPKPFAVTPPNEPLHMKAPFAPQPASVAPATRNAKAPNPRGAAPPGDPPPPAPSDKPRRLMVSLTPGEYETLGIIGVKKNTTRHQLLRNALDEYLALLVEEFSGDCQCIYSGGSCSNSCSTSL